MTDQAAIAATMTKTTFRQECTVTATIHATPEKIWRLLTDIADMVPLELHADEHGWDH